MPPNGGWDLIRRLKVKHHVIENIWRGSKER